MAAAAIMLAGCKAKTEKVTDQQIEEAVEQCCGDCDGCGSCAEEPETCYLDENGEVHCTGEAAEHQCCGKHDGAKCEGNCEHKCDGQKCEGKKCDGACEHKCEGKKCDGNCNGGEKQQGAEAAAKGQCNKCAKCQPCPMDINIPVIIDLVNKAKAAGKVTPELQKQYNALKSHASDCFECGACEGKCPNEVSIISKMKEAVKLFGK